MVLEHVIWQQILKLLVEQSTDEAGSFLLEAVFHFVDSFGEFALFPLAPDPAYELMVSVGFAALLGLFAVLYWFAPKWHIGRYMRALLFTVVIVVSFFCMLGPGTITLSSM